MFAQIETVARELDRAAARWGLLEAVLIGIILAGAVAFVCVARWLKPKFDRVLEAHLGLVSMLTASMPAIKGEIEGVREELQKQTISETEQTRMMGELADKIGKWPSDADKLCRIEQALLEAGITRQVVDALVASARQHDKDKRRGAGSAD